MLQFISHGHDTHHIRTSKSSLDTLTASLNDGKAHLLLACSGSVATIKLPNMIQALAKYPSSQLSIRIILTPSASRFLAGQSQEQPTVSSLTSLPNVDAVGESIILLLVISYLLCTNNFDSMWTLPSLFLGEYKKKRIVNIKDAMLIRSSM
jgi:hypothetical protein